MAYLPQDIEKPFYRDAFGKWRVSTPSTLFDAHFVYDEQPLLFDTIEDGSATLTHQTSYLDLDVTALASDRVVHQSKRYMNYQPGKSLQWLMTGVLETSGGAAGVTCRMGLFDNHADKTVDSGGDGVFFELDGTTLYVVVRSYVSGSQVDTRVAQSAWNGDRLDGSGGATNPSGITLDISKTNIYSASIEWLGVGSVFFTIIINGIPYLVHTAHHANLTLQVPYMRRATLPLRWEISTDGTNAGQMRAVCCTVISEGGFNPRGKIYSIDNEITPLSVSGTLQPILSLRLSNAKNRVTINPIGVETLTSSNALYHYEIWIGSSLTGASWVSAGTNSAAEYDVSATAVSTTGAIQIGSGYFTQTQSGLITNFENTLLIVSDIAGTSDILTIAARKIGGGSADVYAAVQWQEWE